MARRKGGTLRCFLSTFYPFCPGEQAKPGLRRGRYCCFSFPSFKRLLRPSSSPFPLPPSPKLLKGKIVFSPTTFDSVCCAAASPSTLPLHDRRRERGFCSFIFRQWTGTQDLLFERIDKAPDTRIAVVHESRTRNVAINFLMDRRKSEIPVKR